MSHQKSFSKYIDNTISKKANCHTPKSFLYDKLLFLFLLGPSEKFKIKGTDSTVLSHKSSQRNHQSPALLENTDCSQVFIL